MGGWEDELIVVAGHGPQYRGAFLALHRELGGYELEEIDGITTCGVVAAGDRVFRLLSSDNDQPMPELIEYDERGIRGYARLDRLQDCHGLHWDGDGFLVPCSEANEIVWLDRHGGVTRRLRLPGDGDAWHVNGLVQRDGRLYASAFGMFADNAELCARMGEPTGVLFEVDTLRVVLSGFRSPHDPLYVDGAWSMCESRAGTIVRANDATGARERSVDLGGWTRGVAVGVDRIYVGVSRERHGGDDAERAEIVVLDRATWSIVDRITLPCREVHVVSIVPRRMLSGLRRAFRTNPHRTAIQDREDLMRAVGNVHPRTLATPMPQLAPESCSVVLEAQLPERAQSQSPFDVRVIMENRGDAILFTAMPSPVCFAWRWERGEGAARTVVTEGRAALDRAVGPAERLDATLSVDAPAEPGEYRLRLSLVQEWVRWFDDVDARGGVSGQVRVA